MKSTTDWQERANCRGIDFDLFFPVSAVNSFVRRVCDRCEVKSECLNEGMKDPENVYGVWGGLTREQRKKLASA